MEQDPLLNPEVTTEDTAVIPPVSVETRRPPVLGDPDLERSISEYLPPELVVEGKPYDVRKVFDYLTSEDNAINRSLDPNFAVRKIAEDLFVRMNPEKGYTKADFDELMANPNPDNPITPEKIIAYHTGLRNPSTVNAFFEAATRASIKGIPSGIGAEVGLRLSLLPFPAASTAKVVSGVLGFGAGMIAGNIVGEVVESSVLPTTGVMPNQNEASYAGETLGMLVSSIYPSARMSKMLPENINFGSAAVDRFLSNLKSVSPQSAGWLTRFKDKIVSGPAATLGFAEKVLAATGETARTNTRRFMGEQLAAVPVMTGAAALADRNLESDLAKEAAVIASGFVSPTRIVTNATSASTSTFSKIVSKFRQQGREDAAAVTLVDWMGLMERDPAAAMQALTSRTIVDETGNVIALSPAQVLGEENPGLMALSKIMNNSNGRLSSQVANAGKEGIQKINNLIKMLRNTADPDALQLASEVEYQKITSMIRANLEAKVAGVRDAAEAVGTDPAAVKAALDKIIAQSPDMPRVEALKLAKEQAAKMPRVNSNELIRNTTREAIIEWRTAERAAYDGVNWQEELPAENVAALWQDLTKGPRQELPPNLAPFSPWIRSVLPKIVPEEAIDSAPARAIAAQETVVEKAGENLRVLSSQNSMASKFLKDYKRFKTTGGPDTSAADAARSENARLIQEKWNFIKENQPDFLKTNPGKKATQVQDFEDIYQIRDLENFAGKYPKDVPIPMAEELDSMATLAASYAKLGSSTDDPILALQDLRVNLDKIEGLSNKSRREIDNLAKEELGYYEKNVRLGDLRGKEAAGRGQALDADPEDAMTTFNQLQKLRSVALSRMVNARSGNADWGDAAIWSKIAHAADNDLGVLAEKVQARVAAGETISPNQQALLDARAISKAGNDVFSRSFAGNILKTDTSGADKFDVELLHEKLFSGSGDAAALRFRELQEAAAFAATSSGNNALARSKTIAEAYDSLLRKESQDEIFDQVQAIDIITGKPMFDASGKPITELVVNPTKFSAFNDKYAGILDVPAFAPLRADLQNAQGMQYYLDAAKREQGAFWDSMKAESGFIRFVDIDGYGRTNAGRGIGDVLSRGNENSQKQFAQVIGLATKEKDPVKREVYMDGLRTSVMNWAIDNSKAGDGVSIDPTKLRNLLFNNIPRERPSVMSMLQDKGVIDREYRERLNDLLDRMKTISEEASSGSMSMDLFETNLGARALARIVGAEVAKKFIPVGGTIQTPGIGAGLAVNMLDKAPNVITSGIIQEALAPGNTDFFNLLVKKGIVLKNRADARRGTGIIKSFFEKTFGAPIIAAPATVRAAAAISPVEPVQPQGDIVPPRIPAQTTQPEPAPSPPPPPSLPPSSQQSAMTPPPAPRPAAQSPQTRSQYSALFPNDMLSPMINSQQGGITSLMG
jgi:hypothetical protein